MRPLPIRPEDLDVRVPEHRAPGAGVVVASPQVIHSWKPGVAAVLSLVIPGAGQIYKEQLGRGLLFLFLALIGYFLMILPGIVMHLVAVVDAATSDPHGQPSVNREPTRENPPPRAVTPEMRRKQQRDFILVFGGLALLLAGGIVASRFASSIAPSTTRTSTADEVANMKTRLRELAEYSGERCAGIEDVAYRGLKNAEMTWAFRCEGGKTYVATIPSSGNATLVKCDGSQPATVPCISTQLPTPRPSSVPDRPRR